MRLNVGCGRNPLPNYVNVDKFVEHPRIINNDICDMTAFHDQCADHITANYIFEHLTFPEEKAAFHECMRLLKPGGELVIKVPDFEDTVKKWLAAKDEWKCFYKRTDDRDDPEYGFGWGNSMESRWGVIMTHIFGSHSASGLVHLNAYTEAKIKAVYASLGLEMVTVVKIVEEERGYPIQALIARGFKH